MIMYSETSENLLCTVRLMRTDYVVYSETGENWLMIMYSETGENW